MPRRHLFQRASESCRAACAAGHLRLLHLLAMHERRPACAALAWFFVIVMLPSLPAYKMLTPSFRGPLVHHRQEHDHRRARDSRKHGQGQGQFPGRRQIGLARSRAPQVRQMHPGRQQIHHDPQQNQAGCQTTATHEPAADETAARPTPRETARTGPGRNQSPSGPIRCESRSAASFPYPAAIANRPCSRGRRVDLTP